MLRADLRILACCVAMSAANATEQAVPVESPPLFAVTVSDDPQGEIGPGGWESTLAVDQRFVPKMVNCMAGVMKVGRSWAATKQLAIEADRQTDAYGQLVILARAPASGMYELVYRFSLAERRATATFYFYDASSTRRSPSETPDIAALKSQVAAAMVCNS
jgi:hypothetical protein